MRVRSFNSFLKEDIEVSLILEQLLVEEAKPKKKTDSGGSDTKGKLHELLVGYHLMGGKHMAKHRDEEGDTPEQAHEKLKAKVSPEDYERINYRAKSAADDIRKTVEKDGHKVHDVHWTSKPGDLETSTGIPATQKQDASDIVVHSKNKSGKVKHHGVSLKVTDGTSKHVPVSNPGMESTYGAQKILDKHRKGILRDYKKELSGATNAEKRKEVVRNNPKMDSDIKSRNGQTLHAIAKHVYDHLKKVSPDDLADHIKTHVLQSHPTPMQLQGHEHLRHTTYNKKGMPQHTSHDPSEHYAHIFATPHKIHMEHSGTQIHFFHDGKKFASHRIKFNSQSDPLSSVKGSGIGVGD